MAPHEAYLIGIVKETPDITMPELADRLFAERGVSYQRLRMLTHRAAETFKRHAGLYHRPSVKTRGRWYQPIRPFCRVFCAGTGSHIKKSLMASECARKEVREKRRVFITKRQPCMRLQPHRLVFIDGERDPWLSNAVNRKMTPLRGRSPKGERLNADAPFGHWGTQTFIAGLRYHGLTAPWIIDKAMNRAAFDAYIETQLAPTLEPGDGVVLDNLSVHKSAKAAAILKERGAWFLFLPPYTNGLGF